MSLAAMIAAHDDVALEALASKGLVRRASRETGEVMARDDNAARITTDDQTVEIDASGPTKANCTCPATGLCRHILTAVMALRTDAAPAVKGPTAREEIAALDEEAIRKFAGADWNGALALANASRDAEIGDAGVTCAVTIPSASAPVSFIAGQGLRGAAFKGVKSRARLLVTCAALILRASAGQALPETTEAETIGIVPTEFLETVIATLETATPSVLVGAADLAQDSLFDLAISARAATAPRLTAQLRSLAKQAGLARTRHVDFVPERFLADAARTTALSMALRTLPTEVALTGTLRRDYVDEPPVDVTMLGAKLWRTGSGARGLTLHGVTSEGRWVSASMARGAGMDPTFDPREAFHGPLWGAGSASSLIGQTVHLPRPRIASDGQIALKMEEFGAIRAPLSNESLEGVLHDARGSLYADLAERTGSGLRRAALPTAVLIAPSDFGVLAFDDMAQVYRLPINLADRESIALSFPGTNQWIPGSIVARARQVRAILVEVRAQSGSLDFDPVSIIVEQERKLQVLNVQFDAIALKKRKLAKLSDKLRAAMPRFRVPVLEAQNPIRRLADQALSAACDAAIRSPAPALSGVIADAEALGLSALADSARGLQSDPCGRLALRVAYLADEILAGSAYQV